MGIARFTASADNTITNAFKGDLSTRGTGSNMGLSDILETFVVYGQADASSVEKSRILINFPMTPISSSRVSGSLPDSGSVSFYLRMFNAEHGRTLPRDYVLEIRPVKADWQEGYGLDMDDYSDETNNSTGSNWINANGNSISATATFVGTADLDDASGTSLILVNADASTVTFTTDPTKGFGDVTADTGDAAATATILGTADLDDASGTSFKLVNADGEIVTFTTNPAKAFGDTVDETASPFTVNTDNISGGSETRKATQAFWTSCKAAIDAGVLDMTISPTTFEGTETSFTLTQTTVGTTGNTAITLITGVTANGETTFTGGTDQEWRVNTKDISGGSEVRKATQAFWIACKGAIDDGELDMTINPTTFAGTEESFTLTQTTLGADGNTAITLITGMTANGETSFTGGKDAGTWSTAGGDYWGMDDVSSSFSASFPIGNENLELDITPLVEQWMQDVTGSTGKTNYGLGIMFSSSHETDSRSFYTKKFFGRGTEFFFKRPAIEARWDSSYRDDRNNFYLSSSIVPAEENLNTLFLYNYVRGQLRDIPTITNKGHQIFVSIFSGNVENTALSGTALLLSVGGGVSNNTTALTSVVTGTRVDTGIYTASFALTGTSGSATLTNLWDVWWTGSTTTADEGINPLVGEGLNDSNATVYRTGSIGPKTFDSFNIHPSTEYVTSITNLRSVYSRNERARFRTFTRTKDWQPTIYNKASTDVEMVIPDSSSFSVYRIIDDLEVISHGTGSRKRNDYRQSKSVYSDDNETIMSFDVSGSYFDIDMAMLEPGYAYGIGFSYYNGGVGSWITQPERFKFRVE